MGFFSKIKQAANFITGGGATVRVNAINPSLTEPFIIKVHVSVKDADIKARNIYFKMRSTEVVVARDIDLMREANGRIEAYREDVKNTVITWQDDFHVADSQVLEANQTYEFEYEMTMPDHLNGTYEGHNAEHYYEIFAGVDAAGNDPDSGWEVIKIY